MCVYVCVCMCVCVCVYVCVCMCVCMCVYMCVCVYVYCTCAVWYKGMHVIYSMCSCGYSLVSSTATVSTHISGRDYHVRPPRFAH